VSDEAAPVTHQDQDRGYTATVAPAFVEGPENLWFSVMSTLRQAAARLQVNGFATFIAPTRSWLMTEAYSPKTGGEGSG